MYFNSNLIEAKGVNQENNFEVGEICGQRNRKSWDLETTARKPVGQEMNSKWQVGKVHRAL